MTEFMRLFGIFCFSCVCFGQVPSVVRQIVHHRKACIYENFHANCGPGTVILIVEALFGRMRNDSGCFALRPGESPCSADAQLFAEKQCSGRRSCSLNPNSDNLKHVASNCSKYEEKFLDIAYRCENVYSADDDETCVPNRPLIVRPRSGFLASVVTDETGKGSSVCPWRFEPAPGESVHLTLMDFGVWVDRGERDRRGICRIYATIRYVSASSPPAILVCAGNERERSVITTATTLEIGMTNKSTENAVYFLFKFQVCPSIKTPPGAEVDRSGGGTRVFCSDEKWIHQDLRCEGGFWVPPLNLTCSTTTTGPPPSSSDSESLCPDYTRSNADGSSVDKLSPIRLLITCDNKDTFEVLCSFGKWMSAQNKTCSSSTEQTASLSFSWEKYFVPGGLVLLAVVVVIIVVIMCFSRRNKTPKMNEMNQRSLDNNSYIGGGGSAMRPMSGDYDVLDEYGMQAANGSSAPVPGGAGGGGCASSYSVCGAPQTLPRNDPWSSGSGGCLPKRRSDSLPPLHRRLPEPHEYTTTLPRDSTYLVPKEDFSGGDNHHYDTVKGGGGGNI